MELVQYRSLEKGNAGLQEWIREELAQGEVLQRQYEGLLERQTRLCTLLQAKSLKAVEKKSRARQKELEEMQESLEECRSRRAQCQLHVHKQEKENRRMAESLTELENKVFKQRRKEKSGKDLLREMTTEGGSLKRHLSAWEAECRAEDEKIGERQQQLEKRRATLQELSLRSQELPRAKTPLEDRAIEAQLEADLFQKKTFFGRARTLFLWEERPPGWTERLLCQEPEGTSSKGRLPSRCFLCPALWTACRLLWAFAKALLLLLFVTGVLSGFFFSGCPCARLTSAPLLYVQPEGLLPPLYS